MKDDCTIAVVDVETTGLSPWRHDRVVEIAIVLMDANGNVRDEYETLVNPGRDVGPTSIHGITASDVVDAPPFSEIAGDVVARLRQATLLAGHNVSFDHRFLIGEFERLPARFPEVPLFCTCSRLGRQNLAACCDELGIVLDDAPGDFHSALFDARATSKIVARLLAEEPDLIDVPIPAPEWPALPAGRAKPLPREAARRRAAASTEIMQRSAPRSGDSRSAAAVAPDLKGKRVCFTGELQARINGEPVTRPIAQQLAEQAGLVIAGNVSKKLDLLVAADPSSLSGKARKAREYGIRIVAEPAFWTMIGIAVE